MSSLDSQSCDDKGKLLPLMPAGGQAKQDGGTALLAGRSVETMVRLQMGGVGAAAAGANMQSFKEEGSWQMRLESVLC